MISEIYQDLLKMNKRKTSSPEENCQRYTEGLPAREEWNGWMDAGSLLRQPRGRRNSHLTSAHTLPYEGPPLPPVGSAGDTLTWLLVKGVGTAPYPII